MSLRFAFGLCFPIYCAFLLIGCVYLSNKGQPQDSDSRKASYQLSLPIKELDSGSAPNFKAIQNIDARKRAFFEFFKPIIDEENRYQLEVRALFETLRKNYEGHPDRFSSRQRELLNSLAKHYSIDSDQPEEQIEHLDKRIGEIPLALVLAQAATESAWGTSRFAREGNNYFGQWCFSTGCGIVPKQRKKGATHEVAKFASPSHSVNAYFNNINTFSAYKKLRQIRRQHYAKNKPVTSTALLAGLERYSEKGERYLTQLQTIIRQNDLENWSNQ